MSMTGDLLRGHTEAILLAQLLKQDSYGYEISKHIAQLTGGTLELKEATLYTAFRRLEAAGLIASYWSSSASGARRRYYTLTPQGREAHARQVREWEQTQAILDRLLKESE